MQRIPVTERPNLADVAAEHELEYNAGQGVTGWDESAYYQFTPQQIEEDIVGPAEEIEDLCLQVVGRAVENEEVLSRLGVIFYFRVQLVGLIVVAVSFEHLRRFGIIFPFPNGRWPSSRYRSCSTCRQT